MAKKQITDIFRIKQPVAAGRIELLDYLRGMSMLLVLLHHSGIPYGEWILAFHMPLLFLLSGYTDSLMMKQWKFFDYLKNRVNRLIVPYFLFELINLAVWAMILILQGSWQDISEACISILTCINTEAYVGFYGRLWFLPCMFVSDIYFFFVKKLCKENKLGLCVSAIVFLVGTWYTSNILGKRLPFTLDTACFATAFLIFGYVLKDVISWLLDRKHVIADILLLAGLLIVMRFCVVYRLAWCLMFINNYGLFQWSVLAALSGSFAFLIIAKWLYALSDRIKTGKNFILWLSYNSLATFPVHLSIKMVILLYMDTFFAKWYIMLAIMILLNIPIVNAITQYCPILLGKYPVLRKEQIV